MQALAAGVINQNRRDTTISPSYTEVKEAIAKEQKIMAIQYVAAGENDRKKIREQVCQLWINSIGTGLYRHWKDTPWDFNGTTQTPKQGAIACGYFVTTMLQEMGMKLHRVRLSTCAASEMMQQLVPHQKMNKLNNLTYNAFCDSLLHLGKGVYIIGLDYHVGFIVNDGQAVWFVHSYFVEQKGVTKEAVSLSASLYSSNTKWLVSLTGDTAFVENWLKTNK